RRALGGGEVTLEDIHGRAHVSVRVEDALPVSRHGVLPLSEWCYFKRGQSRRAFCPSILRLAVAVSPGRLVICCTLSGHAVSPCGQSVAKSQRSSPSSCTQNSTERSQLSMAWK